MRRRAARTLGRLAALALLGYAAFCTVLSCAQSRLIYPRHLTGPVLSEAEIPEFVERWWLEPSDLWGGRVEAWFMPGDGCTSDAPGPAVVLLHGNAELIDRHLRTAEMYRRLGASVLMPEYRGYGRSAGTPGQREITEDLLAFHAMLVARPEVDASRLVYHGVSLGTGFACVLADARPPRVLILNAPFRSVASLAGRFLAPGFLVRSPLRSDEVLATDVAPVLIFHGTHDGVVPVSHGRTLARLAPRAKLVELACGHNDLPPSWGAYRDQIASFLVEHGVTGVRGSSR